jgi:hypothetical protein
MQDKIFWYLNIPDSPQKDLRYNDSIALSIVALLEREISFNFLNKELCV